MKRQSEGHSVSGVAVEEQQAYCSAIAGTCLVVEVGRRLGTQVGSAILDFIYKAEEGARLTIQRSRDGFTVQVTEAIQRSEGDSFGLEEARALRCHVDQLTRGLAKD